jgi:hypothetical protein
MATQTTAQAVAVPAAPKAQRSFCTALRGDEGAVLRIVVVFRRNGTANSFVIHSVKDAKGKNVNTRGASEAHDTADEARERAEELVEQAEIGMQERAQIRVRPHGRRVYVSSVAAPKAKKTKR